MIKAKRDELLAPLAAVSGIIERRHTLPILSNVLIDASAEALSFLATDIEIQISARICRRDVCRKQNARFKRLDGMGMQAPVTHGGKG